MGLTHGQLLERVDGLAAGLGILAFGNPDSRRVRAGLPDRILIGPYGVLWREVKTGSGRLSPAQRAAGYMLQAAGQDWSVWWPGDWASGRIEQQMRAIAFPN